MTYTKKTLLASAIALAFSATPAFAGSHADMGDKMKHKDAMHHTSMKLDAATKAKLKASMTAEEKAAWPNMSKEERKAWKMQKLESWDMKSDAMNKTKMQKTNMKMDDATKMKLMNSMTAEEKAAWPNMSKEERKAWKMKKMESWNMKKDARMMNDASMSTETVGEVLQEDAMSGQTEARAIVVPAVGAVPVTTVNCPAGSTAQPNGTCMLNDNETLNFETSTSSNLSMNSSQSSMSTSMNTQSDVFVVQTGETPNYNEYKGTLRPGS